MGLGMFQKHRREREAYALASLAEAVDAAETDEERDAAQEALERAKVDAEASAQADAAREDTSGPAVPDWEPVDEARGQEPGEAPSGDEDPAAIEEAEQEAQEAAEDDVNTGAAAGPPEGDTGAQEAVEGPEKPNGGASRDAWYAWATHPQGGARSEEDLKDLGRDAIRDLFA